MKSKRRIYNAEFLKNGMAVLNKSYDLYRKGLIPPSIEVEMMAVPARRVMRAIYGSEAKAVWAQVKHLVGEWVSALRFFCEHRVLSRDFEVSLKLGEKAKRAEDQC